MRATVIIPTRNRGALLGECLRRLVRQSMRPDSYEIIVVDDGSTDEGTSQAVDAARTIAARANADRGPALQLLAQERGGASRARNLAIAAARGDVLVFVDDDAFVGEHFVERHVVLHEGGRPALVAGGIVQVRAMPPKIDESPGLRAYHRHPMPGGNASAPAASVRRAGGYDPWFSSYGWQDQELGERLLRAGLRRRFAWGAPIYHYKPPTYDLDLREQLARELERGRMGARFYFKHPRLTIGLSTKVWPPLRAGVAGLSRLFAIDELRARVERGDVDGRDITGWRAALLRARAESASGATELERLARLHSLTGATAE